MPEILLVDGPFAGQLMPLLTNQMSHGQRVTLVGYDRTYGSGAQIVTAVYFANHMSFQPWFLFAGESGPAPAIDSARALQLVQMGRPVEWRP